MCGLFFEKETQPQAFKVLNYAKSALPETGDAEVWGGKLGKWCLIVVVYVWCVRTLRTVAASGPNVNDGSTVEETVNNVVCDRGVSQGGTPFLEADAGCDDHGCTLLACTDQVEKKAGIFGFGANMSDVIDDQKVHACEAVDQIIGGVVGQSGIK